jgi:hypothetical protein
MNQAKNLAEAERQVGVGDRAEADDEVQAQLGVLTGGQLEPQLEAQLGPWPGAAGGTRGASTAGANARAAPPGVTAEKLAWRLEYLGAGGVTRQVEPGQVMSVGERTYFAVRGALPERLPLVYVLHVASSSSAPQGVHVGLLAVVGELGRPGDEVRLPREGTFLFNPAKGQIVVVATEQTLTAEQLAESIKAREPPPALVKTGST